MSIVSNSYLVRYVITRLRSYPCLRALPLGYKNVKLPMNHSRLLSARKPEVFASAARRRLRRTFSNCFQRYFNERIVVHFFFFVFGNVFRTIFHRVFFSTCTHVRFLVCRSFRSPSLLFFARETTHIRLCLLFASLLNPDVSTFRLYIRRFFVSFFFFSSSLPLRFVEKNRRTRCSTI